MKPKIQITQKGIQVILTGLCIIFCYLLWVETRPIEITGLSNGFIEIETIKEDTMVFPSIENTIPNINEFDEMINRPLFSENRQPFVFEETEMTPEKEKTNTRKSREKYSLTAVIITPDKKIAIIQSSKEKELQRVALGESIDNWVIENIEPREIKLTNGNETKTLILEVKNSTNSKKTNNNRAKNETKNSKTSPDSESKTDNIVEKKSEKEEDESDGESIKSKDLLKKQQSNVKK